MRQCQKIYLAHLGMAHIPCAKKLLCVCQLLAFGVLLFNLNLGLWLGLVLITV